MGSVGVPELIVIFVVALLVFGPRKLPEIGKSLGRALAEFQRARNDLMATVEEEVRKIETEPSTMLPREADSKSAEHPLNASEKTDQEILKTQSRQGV